MRRENVDARAEILRQSIRIPMPHGVNPHVDAVVAERRRQGVLELLTADQIETLEAAPEFVGCFHGTS